MKKFSIVFLILSALLSVGMLVLSLFGQIIFVWIAFASFILFFIAAIWAVIVFKTKFINYLALALSIFLLTPYSILIFNTNPKNIEYVIHAGGSLEETYYLNCLEGVQHYLDNDCNLIELDFLFTSDQEIICSHFLEYYEGYSLEFRPTLQQAIDTKIAGKWTTLTFDMVIELLIENPELRIIFDTKEDDSKALINKMLELSQAEGLDLKSKMIIQVYSYEDYLEMNKFGFAEYWFTNYKANYFPHEINNYFGEHKNVTTIVLYEVLWKIYRGLNFSPNKNIAVHTVNDKDFINFMKDRGVDYVYSDFI